MYPVALEVSLISVPPAPSPSEIDQEKASVSLFKTIEEVLILVVVSVPWKTVVAPGLRVTLVGLISTVTETSGLVTPHWVRGRNTTEQSAVKKNLLANENLRIRNPGG